ncbi:hypothetical protein V6N13_142155 [Hibiscus sabdariffa]
MISVEIKDSSASSNQKIKVVDFSGLPKNESSNPKLPIGSRSLTHQEVREFMKKICSRFAAYKGTQFLKQERKEYVIEEPVPDEPAANTHRADKDKFKKHMDDMVDVGCLNLPP